VAGTCECGSEPSGSINCGEFLDYLQPVISSSITQPHYVPSACAFLQWTAATLPHLRVAMTTEGNVLTLRHVAAVQNHDSSAYRGNGLMIVQSGIATVCGCGKANSSDYDGFIVGMELGSCKELQQTTST